jgi:hypothetical protein
LFVEIDQHFLAFSLKQDAIAVAGGFKSVGLPATRCPSAARWTYR